MKKLIVLPFLICITSVFSQTLRESDLERGSDIKGKYTAFETLESDRLEVGDKIEFINYYSRTFSICKGSNDLKKLDLGKPHVGHTFPLEKIKDAIHLFQSGNTIGKVVLTIQD